MSTPIYENRDAGLVVPQFRYVPLATGTRANLASGLTWQIDRLWSDVIVEYITVYHLTGANRTFDAYFILDGNTLQYTGGAMVSGTVYYLYVDPDAEAVVASVNETPFSAYGTSYSLSFEFDRIVSTDANNISDPSYTERLRQL